MGEYEPDDSRKITQTSSKTPIEPSRTGPAEHTTRSREKGVESREGKSAMPKSKEDARWQVREADSAGTEDAAKPHSDS